MISERKKRQESDMIYSLGDLKQYLDDESITDIKVLENGSVIVKYFGKGLLFISGVAN